MVREDYKLNQEALRDLMDFFISLREKFAASKGLSGKELLNYTGLSYNSLYRLEQGIAKNPQLETILRLAGFWGLSDEQVAEVYKAFCDKSKKLKIVDKDICFRARKVSILPSEIDKLKSFWYDQRKENRLTLMQIDKKVGISPSIMSQVENGTKGKALNYSIVLCNLYNITDDQVVNFYHKVLPEAESNNPVNLDELSKEELIDIILKQNKNSDRYYSDKKVKILRKIS